MNKIQIKSQSTNPYIPIREEGEKRRDRLTNPENVLAVGLVCVSAV